MFQALLTVFCSSDNLGWFLLLTPFVNVFSLYGGLVFMVYFLSFYFGSINALKRKPFSKDKPYWPWALFWAWIFFYFTSLAFATIAKYFLCNYVAKVRL